MKILLKQRLIIRLLCGGSLEREQVRKEQTDLEAVAGTQVREDGSSDRALM